MKLTVKEVNRLAAMARKKAVQASNLTDVSTPQQTDWNRIADILENLPVELPESKTP